MKKLSTRELLTMCVLLRAKRTKRSPLIDVVITRLEIALAIEEILGEGKV